MKNLSKHFIVIASVFSAVVMISGQSSARTLVGNTAIVPAVQPPAVMPAIPVIQQAPRGYMNCNVFLDYLGNIIVAFDYEINGYTLASSNYIPYASYFGNLTVGRACKQLAQNMCTETHLRLNAGFLPPSIAQIVTFPFPISTHEYLSAINVAPYESHIACN